MRAVLAVIVAVALLAPAAATAQTQSAIDDPEANLLAELIVIAPTEGPAWWRVSKGDSVVWIMAMPASSLPTGMAWDSKALDRRLKGANAFLTFPRIQVSIGRPAKDEPPVAAKPADEAGEGQHQEVRREAEDDVVERQPGERDQDDRPPAEAVR